MPGPIDESLVAKLKAAVERLAESTQEMLGSHLGQRLREDFPDVDFKRDFGKLDTFLSSYCADAFTRVLQPGGYSLYVSNKFNASSETPIIQPTFWQAFVNPSPDFHLCLDMATLRFEVSRAHCEGASIVRKVSPEENRAVSKEFAEQDPGARSALVEALEATDFWSRWKPILNNDRNLMAQWNAFRTVALLRLLESRLLELEVRTDRIPQLIDAVRKNRPSAKKDPRPKYHVEHTTPTRSSSLRTDVLSAVEQLSDGELLQIWLPVWALRKVRE